ncbi:MAG: TIGR04283 family arsenosugar biosynthesis glycosyltransferase [Vicinamibacterales bacterium]
MPHLAVVIPVLTDSDALRALLADIPRSGDAELVVVDGGHDPALTSLVEARPDTRVIRSARGRGTQMNAGARASTAGLILFLHADSRLPPGWQEALRSLPPGAVGGWFAFALDADAWQARILERLVRLRVALFRLPYGDQGFFVRREVFERLGGFREWPLMEDVDFARRLVAAGQVVEVPLPLRTSARRWQRDGWLRRSLRNVALLSLYSAGVPPARLARWYEGR